MSQRHLPPASAPRPSGAVRRRTVLAAAAAAVPAAGMLGTGTPALADPTVTGGETRVVDVKLSRTPHIEVDGAPGASARDVAEHKGTMLGLTWPQGDDAPEVHVRALRASGGWSDWITLEVAENPETGEDAPGTEVAWLGAFTRVQIRAEIDGADASDALTAHLLTTSPAPADAAVADLTVDSAMPTVQTQRTTTAAAAPVNPATPPLAPGSASFISRAAWGADESLVRGTSAASELKALVIHHTAGTNSYSSGESAQLVRGILRYHTQTLGWADIGYNVLVSKYGQVFEGRGGGLHRHIVGAHAYGFNTGSFGISVMGDYSSTAPPAAARDAVARLIGWKLLSTFQTSVTATSRWVPGSGTRFTAGKAVDLPVIFGHRDVNYTECPGQAFHDRLGSIRSAARDALYGGWKTHLRGFEAGGGRSRLGAVVTSAHVVTAPEHDRTYTVTVLGKGLIISQGGAATAYETPMSQSWRASWGRPRGAAKDEGDRVVQAFSFGMGVLEDGRVRFVEPTLEDVLPGRAYYVDIYDLVAAGVVTGYGGREYRGDEEMRRDHMVAFIHRAAGSPAYTPPATSPFSDVPTTHPFYREITWAHAEGITVGWRADRTFRPLESVRRDHLASFLWRAAGKPAAAASDASHFTDISATSEYAVPIGWLAKTGISRGYSDGTYRPRLIVQRDQMAAFLVRWMRVTGTL